MNTKTIFYISFLTIVVLVLGTILAFSLRSDTSETRLTASQANHSNHISERKLPEDTVDNNSDSDLDELSPPNISGRVIAVKGADNITILDSVHQNPVKIRLRGINLPPVVQEKEKTSSSSKAEKDAHASSNSAKETLDTQKQPKPKDSSEEEARMFLSRMVFGTEIEIRNYVTEAAGSEYAVSGILFRNNQNITLEMLRSKEVVYNAADLDYLSEEARHIYDNFAGAKELVLKANPETELDASSVKPASKVSLLGKTDKSKSGHRSKEADKALKNNVARDDKAAVAPKIAPIKAVKRMENTIKVQ